MVYETPQDSEQPLTISSSTRASAKLLGPVAAYVFFRFACFANLAATLGFFANRNRRCFALLNGMNAPVEPLKL
jgi:hypothetical protein